MMILDYPPDFWLRQVPLKEGGVKTLPYLRIRDILYLKEDEKTAFSIYSSLQHQEEGYAYGCCDLGIIKEEDLCEVDPEIIFGSSLKHKRFFLWVDRSKIETKEKKPLFLSEIIAGLREDKDSQARLTADMLEKLQILFILKEEQLGKFLKTMDWAVRFVSNMLPFDNEMINMWKGISSLLQDRRRI